MELSSLYTTLNNSISNKILTLNTALIDEGNISQFIGTLPGAALTLEEANLTFSSYPPLHLVIEGVVQKGWTLQAVRNATLSQVHVRIAFTQFNTATIKGALEITSCHLLTANNLGVNLKGELRIDNLLHLTLPDGPSDTVSLPSVIEFANSTALNYMIPPLPVFQSGTMGEFDLAFGFTSATSCTFQFSTKPAGDWPITADLAIKDVGVSFGTENRTPFDPKVLPAFHGYIVGTFHIGQDFTVIVSLEGDSVLSLEVRPANGNLLPGLDALGNLIGGAALQQTIEQGIKAMQLEEVSIDDVRVAFDYELKKLLAIAIRSHVTVAGIRVNVGVNLPDFQLAGTLAAGSKISIKTIIEDHFGASDKFPDIDIDKLSVFIHPGKGYYALSFTITSDWLYEISPGKGFGLEKLDVDIEKAPGGVTGSITATLMLAGTELTVAARNSKDNGVSTWSFEVSTVGSEEIPIGKLADDLTRLFGISLPDSLKDITLSNLDITFNTGSGDFTFGCVGHIPFSSGKADVSFAIKLTKGVGGVYTKDITGKLVIGNKDFTFHIKNDNTATHFLATFEQKNSSFSVHDAVAQLSPDIAELIPKSFTISINNAEIAILNTQATGTIFLLGIGLGLSADLGSIPLIGSKLAADHTLSFDGLQLYFASALFTAAQLAEFGSSLLPNKDTARGFMVTANLSLGGSTTALSLPVAATPAPATPTGGGNQPPANNNNAAQSSVRWFQIQRTLGPLSFQRIGVRYESGSIWFLLDVSAQMSGLTFSLRGLAAGSPLDDFDLKFHLSGMGLGYHNGPIAIEGAFLEVDPSKDKEETFHYDGDAILQFPDFTIGAIGSLSNPWGKPSMFIFAELDAPIGGPPYFFVDGFTGGFGYNSRVNLPNQDEVVNFPFVQGLKGQTDPMSVLDVLEGRKGGKTWVEAQIGNNWLAVGIHFTSFELIQGKALLIAEFGEQFEIALLGIMTARFPQNAERLYASVELGLMARFNPGEGFFGLSAVISRNSFVIDPACRLTGGFALYTWFGSNDHAGDFVITLGGYHPQFPKPKWYPAEDRLGFSWTVSNLVSISGEAYFALTPSCIMGGGGLKVLVHDGNLNAWFIASANFLIYWKPFSFTVDFGVSIGVSYRLDVLFIHKTFTIELGAQVSMWGPPTGGKVHISWFIISFTVSFGDQDQPGGGKLEWDDFKTMLPAKEDVCKIRISTGLQQVKEENDKSTRWIVRADELAFTSESAIPALSIQTNSASVAALAAAELPVYNIRPMGVTNASSQQQFYIVGPDGSEIDVSKAGWGVNTITRNVPESLWGKPLEGTPPPSANLVPDNKTGLSVQAPPATLGSSPGAIDMEKDLSYEPLDPQGQLPLNPEAKVDPTVPVGSKTTVSTIFSKLTDTTVQKNRNDIYQLLKDAGIYSGSSDLLTETRKYAGSNFTGEPLLTSSN